MVVLLHLIVKHETDVIKVVLTEANCTPGVDNLLTNELTACLKMI